jgi:hypothetical protein
MQALLVEELKSISKIQVGTTIESVRRYFTNPVPANLMKAFRIFFACHIFLQSLKLSWIPFGIDSRIILFVQLAALAAVFANFHRRLYYPGLILLLLLKLYGVAYKFPMTANHHFLELYVLIFLLLWPDRPIAQESDKQEANKVSGESCHLARLLVLSVYFFAGIQKLIHGIWLNGEYLAHSLFEATNGTLLTTQYMLRFISSISGSLAEIPINLSIDANMVMLTIPGWVVVYFLVMSWTTIVSEISIPLLVVFRRTRKIGIRLMLVLTVIIGLLAFETEFMFASVGCALLFFFDKGIRNYSMLLAAHIVWSLSLLFAGVRIGTL